MEKNKYDPKQVPSVQVSISNPHEFSFSEERKFFNSNHHQKQPSHIMHGTQMKDKNLISSKKGSEATKIGKGGIRDIKI